MIRVRTSRGGWKDLFSSRNASKRLLSTEPQQGRHHYIDRGIVVCRIGSTDETARSDSIWLLVDSNQAGERRCATILSAFATPEVFALGQTSVVGSVESAEIAEQQLCAIAATIDLLPEDVNEAALNREGNKKSLLRMLTTAGLGLLTGLVLGLSIHQFTSSPPQSINEARLVSKIEEAMSENPAQPTEEQITRLVQRLKKALEPEGYITTQQIQSIVDKTVKAIQKTDQPPSEEKIQDNAPGIFPEYDAPRRRPQYE